MRATSTGGTGGSGGSRSQNKPTSRSRGSQQAGRVNRAQVRAMQARAAAAPTDLASDDVGPATATPGASRQSVASASRRRPVARPVVLSRDEEYAFIKQDMRRLAVIAGVLFLLMLVLLFIID